MKHLLYTHAAVRSLLGALNTAILAIVKLRLAPHIRRLLPGPAGRRVAGVIVLAVSMLAQAFMLILLAQLVDLCISLYELWAFMAGKFLEAHE